ncbi:MAG: hypothetical protein ACFFCW_04170 [Candidatus Hodarchaeota archaeon]
MTQALNEYDVLNKKFSDFIDGKGAFNGTKPVFSFLKKNGWSISKIARHLKIPDGTLRGQKMKDRAKADSFQHVWKLALKIALNKVDDGNKGKVGEYEEIRLCRIGNRDLVFKGRQISHARQYYDERSDLINGYQMRLFETETDGAFVLELFYEKLDDENFEMYHKYFDAKAFRSIDELSEFLSSFDPLEPLGDSMKNEKPFVIEFKRAVSHLLKCVEPEELKFDNDG